MHISTIQIKSRRERKKYVASNKKFRIHLNTHGSYECYYTTTRYLHILPYKKKSDRDEKRIFFLKVIKNNKMFYSFLQYI